MDLPDPGIELGSSALQVDSLPVELPGKPREPQGVILDGVTWGEMNSEERAPLWLRVGFAKGDLHQVM